MEMALASCYRNLDRVPVVTGVVARHAVRRRGSHVVMQKRTEESTVTVPVPVHDQLKTVTLRSIIQQSGLQWSLFEGQ